MELRIEVYRNGTWSVRQEGEVPQVSDDQIRDYVAQLASLRYAHRAYADGRLVCEVSGGVKRA